MRRITTYFALIFLAILCVVIFFLPLKQPQRGFSISLMAMRFLAAGVILVFGGIYFKKEFLRVEKIIFEIESLPLLETDEAVDGVPFAGEGVVEPEEGKILSSPYTKTPCVYFHSIKEKYLQKEKWEIVENLAHFVPFWIRDKRGKLKVDLRNLDEDFSFYHIPLKEKNVPDPKNSEIDCEKVLDKVISKRDLFTTTKYRLREFVLKPGTKVFVHGMVSRKNGELVLHEAENHPLIVSRKSRENYVKEFYQGEELVYLSYLFVALGFTFSLLALEHFLKNSFLIISFLLFFGNTLILASMVFSLYNRLITLNQRALNALSNIEVELKRKVDLISNLVEMVKFYVRHESEIQKIITEGRVKLLFSKRPVEEEKPVISSLVATIEKYPDLKASENFQKLMNMLIDTEERIVYSREFYNRTVRKYNTLLKQIPFLFASLLFGLKEMDFITLEGQGRDCPSFS